MFVCAYMMGVRISALPKNDKLIKWVGLFTSKNLGMMMVHDGVISNWHDQIIRGQVAISSFIIKHYINLLLIYHLLCPSATLPSQNRLVIISYMYYVKIWLHDTSSQSHLHLIPSYLDVTGRSLDSIAIAVGANWYIKALVQLKVIENLHVRSKDQLKWYQMFTWHQIRHWFH